MCRKIYEYIFNEALGHKAVVYEGEKGYCFIVIDRDGTNYYIVDFEFTQFFPVTSYIARHISTNEDHIFDTVVAQLFELDLSKIGFGKCALWAKPFGEQMREDIASGRVVRAVPTRRKCGTANVLLQKLKRRRN